MAASASSESQGKTIALVIFVLLTIISGVTAFYFYDQVDARTQERDSANNAAREASQRESTAKQSYTDLRRLVYGEQTEEDHAKVMELVKADLSAPRLADERKARKPDYKSFKDALDFLQDELAADDTRVAEQNDQIKKLQQEIEALQEKYQGQVDEITKDRDAKAQELATETTSFQDLLSQKDQEIAAVSDERLRALNAKQDAEQELERFMQRTEREVKKLEAIIADKSEMERLRDQVEFVKADGKIINIHRSAGNNNIAYLDLGADDGLTKNTTFGVYGLDTGGNPYKMPKARVVVTKILDGHRSQATIQGSKITDPVIPGDLLYSPLWSPGEQITIGVVGMIYMDDKVTPQSSYDLQAQNKEFLQLCKDLGAKVVALYDLDDQKLKGKLDVNTDWLVIGEIPDATANDLQERKVFVENLKKAEKELRTEARENDIRVINVRNFLTFMGKQSPKKTVPAGEEREFLFGKKRPALIDQGPVPANSKQKDKDGN